MATKKKEQDDQILGSVHYEGRLYTPGMEEDFALDVEGVIPESALDRLREAEPPVIVGFNGIGTDEEVITKAQQRIAERRGTKVAGKMATRERARASRSAVEDAEEGSALREGLEAAQRSREEQAEADVAHATSGAPAGEGDGAKASPGSTPRSKRAAKKAGRGGSRS